MKTSRVITVFGAMACALLPVTSAEARIRCVEGFQISNGQRISTPFCQDSYLAKVAREYGQRVSAAAIRRNPSVKRRVCHFVGHDVRAQQACVGTGHDVRGRVH